MNTRSTEFGSLALFLALVLNRVDWADVIVVMNQNLVGRLREFEPYRATLVNLGQFLDPPQKSIADPNFMKSSSPEFTRTLEQVASRALADHLREAAQPSRA